MVFRLLLDINPVNGAKFRVFNQRLICKQKQLELSLNVTNTPIPALSQEKRSFVYRRILNRGKNFGTPG